MDDLVALETWAAPLLAKLQPSALRRLTRAIAVDLRRSQTTRIGEQKDPDGAPFVPRKNAGKFRGKPGRIKRRAAMFTKLRQAKFLRAESDAHSASVGFTGRTSRIARVHQEGLEDKVSPTGPSIRYPTRRLIGFTDAERMRIRDLLLEHLA